MRTLLSFLAGITMSASAMAEESLSLAQSYKQETVSVLQQLKEIGVEKIACLEFQYKDCLSPDVLLQAIESKKVTFKEVHGFKKPDGATRFSAFYSPEEGAVLLNADVPHGQFGRGYVGFHELAGAMNRPEVEYDFSKHVFILIESRNAGVKFKSYELETLKNEIADPAYNKQPNAIDKANSQFKTESGTVFGGGGDGDSLIQRVLFFKYLQQSLISTRTDFAFLPLAKMDIAIEVIDSDSNKINYVIGKKNNSNGWPLKILVPRHLTLEKPLHDKTAPNRALEDVGFYFNGIAPSLFPHLPKARLKYYINAEGEYAAWPTFFSRVHPAVLENKFRPRYEKTCANGCKYLGDLK